jgi:hypothetical protein
VVGESAAFHILRLNDSKDNRLNGLGREQQASSRSQEPLYESYVPITQDRSIESIEPLSPLAGD